MKKILMIVATQIILSNVFGQILMKTDGNLYFPSSYDLRFGSDAAGNNAKWAVEYWEAGLNFWKVTATDGNYRLFLHDNGNVGINLNEPSDIPTNTKLYVRNLASSDGWIVGSHSYVANAASYTNTTNIVGLRGTAYPTSTLSSGKTVGIYGIAGNNTAGYNYGVKGELLGTSNGVGVFGTVSGDASVFGRYAGYFYGDVKISGKLYLYSTEITSDERTKKEIKPFTNNNISKLSKLSCINFKYKTAVEMGTAPDSSIVSPVDAEVSEKVRYGVIAQEVEKEYPELVSTDQNGMLSVNYIGFIPVLIEAIKELETKIETKDKEMRELKDGFSALQDTVCNCCKTGSKLKSATDQTIVTQTPERVVLYQNKPNPFGNSTTIAMEIPESVKTAQLIVYDLTGKQLTATDVTERGSTSVTIQGNQLAAGMYHYALIVDMTVADVKTMILTR